MSDRYNRSRDRLGPMAEWGRFGDDSRDFIIEAERRSFLYHFSRRLAKKPKTGAEDPDLLIGAMMSITNLFISANGGIENITDENRENFFDLATFCWMNSISMISPQQRN